MKIKQFVCLLAAALLTVTTAACSREGSPVMDISGAKIPQDVFAYFLDTVMARPEDYGLPAGPDKTALTDKAAWLCKEYTAINTLLGERGVTLSFDEKSAVSEKVNGKWEYFSARYEAIGVTKQTLHKIESADAAKEALLLFYYDNNGEMAAGEESLKSYYSENYVSFVSINGYLTKTDEDGVTVDLTEQEAAALKSKFEAMRVRIADGESFDAVGEWFAAETGTSSGRAEYRLISKGGSLYPDGFFEQTAALAPGTPAVIQLEKYIFLVMKNELSFEDEAYYSRRTECLTALKGPEVEKMILDEAVRYETDINQRIASRVYKEVAKQQAE